MSESVRCFVAVKLPEAAAARVGETQAHLRDIEPRWKWVDPASFHLTLKFLGAVGRDRLRELWSAICEALQGKHCFTMAVRGLGAFPHTRAPRVAWAGIEQGAEDLSELAEAVETACEHNGFERERRPFTAHLTLGRARRGEAKPELGRAIEQGADLELGEASVERVLLMQSELRPYGAVYTVLEDRALEQGEAR